MLFRSIPPEVLARYNAVNAQAQAAAAQPFQAYGGQFVAPLTATQQAGIAATYGAAGAAEPYYQAAAGLTAAGAGPVMPEQLQTQRYMNPFTQNVVEATQRALQQQQGQQRSQQQAEAIRGGAYGGDRSGIQRAVLQGQQGLATAQAISPLYQQGYSQALQTAQQQQGVGLQAQQANLQRALAAGQQFGALGTGAQQAGLAGAQALLGAGTLQQQTQQADLTARYQQFLQERGYPFQVAQFLAAINLGNISAFLDGCPIDEHRISNLGDPIPQCVVNLSLLWVRTLTPEILINQLDKVDVVGSPHIATQGSGLTEKGIELPKLLLLPLIERMVVALRALDLQSQENFRDRRRRLHPLLLVDLHGQEVGSAVKVLRARLGRPRRSHQLTHHRVIRLVRRKAVPQVLLHPLATR